MRVELSDASDARSPQGRGIPGATAYVYLRGTSTQVTVYVAASGATAISQPLTADAYGRFAGYVEENSLDLVISHPKFVTWTEQYEAVSGQSPGGRELGYAEITSDSVKTGTARGAGSTPLLLSTVVQSGVRPVYVEFNCGQCRVATATGFFLGYISESPAGAGTWTDIGFVGGQVANAATTGWPAHRSLRRAPRAAGSWDYKFEFYGLTSAGASGTATVRAATGADQAGPASLAVFER